MAEYELVIIDVPVPVPVVPEGGMTPVIVDAVKTSETRMNRLGQIFNMVLKACQGRTRGSGQGRTKGSDQGRTKGSGQASKKENENSQTILPWVIFGAMALGVGAAATVCGVAVFTKKSGDTLDRGGETLERAGELFKTVTASAKKWTVAPPVDVHIDKVHVNVDHTWYKRG